MTWGYIAAAAIGALMQNQNNSAQAVRQENFQREMSDTAHQREVRDLRRAGLNPILSGTGGAGSSTPSGAMARQEDVGAAAVNAALAARANKAQVALLEEQALNTHWDTELKSANTAYMLNQVMKPTYETQEAKYRADIARSSAKGASSEEEIDTTGYGKFMRYLDRGVKSVTGGGATYRNLQSK